MRWWYRGWQYVAQVVFCALYRVRVWGRENVPLDGPVLLVSNHQSFLDPVLCGVGLGRELDYVARDSLFRNRFFSRYIRSLNAFSIRREQADIGAVKAIIERLQQGRAVVLFPEATRTSDGRIRPIKSGFELIARRGRATTVPVVIDGAFEVWPRQQALPGMGEIRVMYGRPIVASEARRLRRQELVDEVNARLRQMQGELRGRYDRRVYNYDDER